MAGDAAPGSQSVLEESLVPHFPCFGSAGLVRVGGYWLKTQVLVGEAAQMVRHWNRPSYWVLGLQKASTV